MDGWKSRVSVEGKNVTRLQIPAISKIFTYMRTGTASVELEAWIIKRGLTIPPLRFGLGGVTLVPSTIGILYYQPKNGDANYRDENQTAPNRTGIITYETKPLFHQTSPQSIAIENTNLWMQLFASAYSEFDEYFTRSLSYGDELAMLSEYGNGTLFGTYRAARFCLAQSLLSSSRHGAVYSVPTIARVFLKYSNPHLSSLSTIRMVIN